MKKYLIVHPAEGPSRVGIDAVLANAARDLLDENDVEIKLSPPVIVWHDEMSKIPLEEGA